VAIERFVGTVHGQTGTFILQHSAIMDRGEGTLNVVVVPDTGTGDLAGMRGAINIEITDGKHNYALEYEL
jgi:hypothetical protein